jgi:hypothetical protein
MFDKPYEGVEWKAKNKVATALPESVGFQF